MKTTLVLAHHIPQQVLTALKRANSVGRHFYRPSQYVVIGCEYLHYHDEFPLSHWMHCDSIVAAFRYTKFFTSSYIFRRTVVGLVLIAIVNNAK